MMRPTSLVSSRRVRVRYADVEVGGQAVNGSLWLPNRRLLLLSFIALAFWHSGCSTNRSPTSSGTPTPSPQTTPSLEPEFVERKITASSEVPILPGPKSAPVLPGTKSAPAPAKIEFDHKPPQHPNNDIDYSFMEIKDINVDGGIGAPPDRIDHPCTVEIAYSKNTSEITLSEIHVLWPLNLRVNFNHDNWTAANADKTEYTLGNYRITKIQIRMGFPQPSTTTITCSQAYPCKSVVVKWK
jgi:hypothetical protein